MYDLLGSNMTFILGHNGPDWRTGDEFRKWEKGALLDGLGKSTIYLLSAKKKRYPDIDTVPAVS